MIKYFLFVFCCSVLFWNSGTALRCRTGNDEENEQYYRVMDNCKKSYMMQEDNNSDFSSDESTYSNENPYDRRFMSNGKFYGNSRNMGTNFSTRNNQRQNNWDNRSPQSDLFNRNMSRFNGRDNTDNQRFRPNRRNMNNWHFTNTGGTGNFDPRFDIGRNNYDNQPEQSCVVQCFFSELNLVDQRGYPDRTAVSAVLQENIQSPELRDFIQEAIVQCFHYLSIEGKQSNCQFSQGLFNCFIEKGEERCDDWNRN